MLELLEKFQIAEEVNDISGQVPFLFEKESFDALNKIQSLRQKIGQDYPLLNMDFLKMRNKDSLPKFAVFTLNEPIAYFKTTLEFFSDGRCSSVILDTNCQNLAVVSRYYDIFKLLRQHLWFESLSSSMVKKSWVTLQTKFPGIIPANIRNQINEVRPHFDEVVIIAEAPKWEIDGKIIHYPPNPDPLVVGIKDKFCYLVNSFDVTLLENYIVKEFTE